MPSSRGSSEPRDPTQVSCTANRFFTIWTTRKSFPGVRPRIRPVFFHGQRKLAGYSPWGHRESDSTQRLIVSLSYIYIYLYIYFYLYIYQHTFNVGNLKISGYPDTFEQSNILWMIISSSYLFSHHLLDINCMAISSLSNALSFNSQGLWPMIYMLLKLSLYRYGK